MKEQTGTQFAEYTRSLEEGKERENALLHKNEELKTENKELRAKVKQIVDALEANGRYLRMDKENTGGQFNMVHSASRPHISVAPGGCKVISPRARISPISRSPIPTKSKPALVQSPRRNIEDLIKGLITLLSK